MSDGSDDLPLTSLLAPPVVAAPERPAPLLQRFPAPSASPPKAAYCIVGKTFATYSSHTVLQMGRSHALAGSAVPLKEGVAGPATLSLGDAKVVSRDHLELRWDAATAHWTLRAIGKNGFWIGTDAAHKIVPMPKDEAKSESTHAQPAANPDTSVFQLSARRATQFRIGLNDEAALFWFVPVVPEPKKRAPATSSGAMTTTTNAKDGSASDAKTKKRKQEDGEGAAAGGPDGKVISKKKRKKATAPPPPTDGAPTPADLHGVITLDDDSDMPTLQHY